MLVLTLFLGPMPVKSVFKAAEEDEKKMKLSFPKRKKVSQRKKLKDELEEEKKKMEEEKKKIEELNLEELYPSMPTAEDSKPHNRFPMNMKMVFVK